MSTTLPCGSNRDGFKIYLFARIFDNLGGFSQFNLEDPVLVYPNLKLVSNLVGDIVSSDANFIKNLSNMSVEQSAQEIFSLTLMMRMLIIF